MKKFLSLILAAMLLVTLLAGCGSEPAADYDEDGEGSGLIGVCMQNMSSSIAELQSTALTKTFEALGYDVQVVSADDSVSNQVQQVQNFILMGEVVSEAERIENPVYCEMIASRVTSFEDAATEMDISGDNRSVVAGVLTDNPDVRVIIAYNSLVSTAGSQYIMDTYPEDEQNEFAFFSGGVMGDEYEYLIGSVSDSGTKSVFRGACQFGGGDAAATLANLAYNVMFGEAGVDYGKSNPNSIGLFFPIDAELNGGNAALVCFDTSPYIESFTYEEVLARENLMVYWDAENGYNESMQESNGGSEDVPDVTGGEIEGGTAYIGMMEGIGGAEAHEFDLMDDGTCKFFLPGNTMITDVYEGTYVREGDTLTITGLANVDASSPYAAPGLWSFIDSATGDAVVTVDDAAGTFTPVE